MNPILIWVLCFGFLFVGLYRLLDPKTEFRNDRIMYFGFCVPIIYWFFDRVFKFISLKINKRDFILYLRGSDEINNGFGAKNHHIKGLDILFSFTLIFIILATLLIGINLLR